MARALPTGTLTFLFSDVEGSTRLLQELGPRYPEVLETHHRLLREAFEAHGGVEVNTEGDAFFVVFPSAGGAIAGAVAAQHALAAHAWPGETSLRVRIGLHTGEGALGGDDYVGLDVHRAARIAAAGHGGQVLLSGTTRELVRHALPEGVELRDHGEHRLKDLARPEHLFDLLVPGLRSDFPSLRTLDATPNNLPLQLTEFVGRERELAEARRLLLDGARLLTLTGPGGIGKTRLSLQLAAEVSDRFPEGVHFVPLASGSDQGFVPSAIAQVLGVPEAGPGPLVDRIVERLREKRVLLVLDNFEQVLGAAPLVGQLLRGSPQLKVIVTSRAPTRIYGEREYPVPPLAVPDPRRDATPEGLSQYAAVRLFIERAVAIRPSFAVTNENAPAVAEICARLDGLPLAIELAAARVKLLTPQAILARLQSRLDLLTGGARDLPARQQTLRGAIAWSHDLLERPDRRLFARFAVFAGGAELDEAEAVCGPAAELGIDVLDGLAALFDQSMVRQSEEGGTPRFAMLETIREYALERLAESGEADELRQRHCAAYLALAERARPEIEGAASKPWIARLQREHENLDRALAWAIERGDAETAMRFTWALWRYWQMGGHLIEGQARAEQVLALPGAAAPTLLRVRALEAAGGLGWWLADLAGTRRSYVAALESARAVGDRAALADALYNVSFTPIDFEGDAAEILAGGLLYADDAHRAARAYLEEAQALYQALGDRRGVGRVTWALADQLLSRREFEAALPLLRESLGISRELGDTYNVGWALGLIALAHRGLDQIGEAQGAALESLRIFCERGDVSGIAPMLDIVGYAAVGAGDTGRGFRLGGAAQTLYQQTGSHLVELSRESLGLSWSTLLESGGEAARTTWAAGQKLTMDEAVALAMGEAAPGT